MVSVHGAPASLKAAWQQAKPLKHKLRVTADVAGEWIMFCKNCGGYASIKAVKLADRCKGQANRQGTTQLNRIYSRKHPLTGQLTLTGSDMALKL